MTRHCQQSESRHLRPAHVAVATVDKTVTSLQPMTFANELCSVRARADQLCPTKARAPNASATWLPGRHARRRALIAA